MLFLSQLLYKKILKDDKPFAKVMDFTVSDNQKAPPVASVLIKKSGKKYLISADAISFQDNIFTLKNPEVELLPVDEHAFYLAEDLMDKQVIDVTGKRLVRVNDVVMETNGHLRVTAIDIGFAGITRRLGLGFPKKTITLPWQVIEAFDYQTGDVKIKLTQNKLNTFHPAEVADILEEAGTKERMGILETLDAARVAQALEEADEETQEAILEELPTQTLKTVVNKMPVDEIADVIKELNPEKMNEIFRLIGAEKARKVKRLLTFDDDVAGGLMDVSFYKEQGGKTIGEALGEISKEQSKPETIVIINENNQLLGTVAVKDLVNADATQLLKNIITATQFVFEDAEFPQILRIFAEYNLRLLPVLNGEHKVVGVIPIDNVLSNIQEEEEEQDEFH